jgi:hypothetical protein
VSLVHLLRPDRKMLIRIVKVVVTPQESVYMLILAQLKARALEEHDFGLSLWMIFPGIVGAIF